MKILHLADIHLDRPFVRGDRREGDRDRARLRETFTRCLHIAREHSVDAVTIGGDLWEDEHVTTDTRRFVAAELGRVGSPVLMLAGNHDPLTPGGNYERTEWPDNVHLYPGGATSERRVGGVSVWGLSWTGGPLDPGFLDALSVARDGRTHLLLLHGTGIPFAGALEDASYCPFEASRVAEAGFALCLAGHIHSASQAEHLVYPGSPEPLGWGETGRHCVALVAVEGGGVDVELIDVNTHRYVEQAIDCQDCEHSGEIKERLGAVLDGARSPELHLRAVLQGEVDRECRIDVEELAILRREEFAELVVVDSTQAHYDLEAMAGQPTAAGRFVTDLRQRIADEQEPERKETLELALMAGLRALDGREDVVHVD